MGVRRLSHPLILVCLLLVVAGGCNLAHAAYIHAKAILGQYLIADAWQQTLADRSIHKPWTWADTWPVAQLSIPRLAENLIVLSVDHGQALAFGPGMSGDPLDTRSGSVSVISGHRDTHFRFLDDLIIGDRIELRTPDGNTLVYEVLKRIVASTESLTLDIPEDGRFLLLVTCYPLDGIGATDSRLIQVAQLLEGLPSAL